VAITGSLGPYKVPTNYAAVALGALLGARLADTLVSHVGRYAFGYRPNPGLPSTTFYVFEAVFFFVTFFRGLTASFPLPCVGFVIGALPFCTDVMLLRSLRIVKRWRRNRWCAGEPLPDWTRKTATVESLSMTPEEMLDAAGNQATTPFDYIIVGSGAGGGPLAARLANDDRRVLRVLLLEAGGDAAVAGVESSSKHIEPPLVQLVPGYHPAATEDPEISWGFSVRHYADDTQQEKDTNYRKQHDRSRQSPEKGGIFYPRCSALGGCTAHHAMIIIAPNDRDWEEIAKLTGDDSWRAKSMQRYFTRIEKCLYRGKYRDFLRWLFGPTIYTAALKVVEWVKPDKEWHGYRGWQATSLIDPHLVAQIMKGDPTFRNLMVEVVGSLLGDSKFRSAFRRALLRLRLFRFLDLDPNDRKQRRAKPERLVLIPIGTDGLSRVGVRELLLNTKHDHPHRLVIKTEAYATKILFSKGLDHVPTARGVEIAEGGHLYKASRDPKETSKDRRRYFAKKEVIICGGAFNTPQLLMLSGIGDADHLKKIGIEQLQGIDGNPLSPVIHLPGVGLNLQDRYEVSVISELNTKFGSLEGVTLNPRRRDEDPAWKRWLKAWESRNKKNGGLYATNGGTIAFFKRSGVDKENPEADLFIFGTPTAFRGYYWGWSNDVLHVEPRATEDRRDLWTWVILKAYTSNTDGSVRLRTNSPFDTPEICFASFDEGPAGWQKDLAALACAVKFVRQLNAHRRFFFNREVQPRLDKLDCSPDLLEWIRNEAWGHHACGTCRIGSDPWRADTTKLLDLKAVLDSEFRVHGVHNLRVVDASVFPTIPGYFIVTPVFMISEKAADTILAETEELSVAYQLPVPRRVHKHKKHKVGKIAKRFFKAIRRHRALALGCFIALSLTILVGLVVLSNQLSAQPPAPSDKAKAAGKARRGQSFTYD
jgi:choline dehydrogenase-like flavoprotein